LIVNVIDHPATRQVLKSDLFFLTSRPIILDNEPQVTAVFAFYGNPHAALGGLSACATFFDTNTETVLNATISIGILSACASVIHGD
jgi:hypothetical protein